MLLLLFLGSASLEKISRDLRSSAVVKIYLQIPIAEEAVSFIYSSTTTAADDLAHVLWV